MGGLGLIELLAVANAVPLGVPVIHWVVQQPSRYTKTICGRQGNHNARWGKGIVLACCRGGVGGNQVRRSELDSAQSESHGMTT